MPVYSLSIEKQLTSGLSSGRHWTNVYHMDEPTIVEAVLHAPEVVDLEKTVYPDNVTIVRWSLSDPAAPGTGQSNAVSVAGTRGVGTPDTQLPLFNAVLFKFLPATGRASLKYLRLPLDESEVTNGQVEQTLLDAISISWAVPLLALAYITDESGNSFAGYGFNHAVSSRQTGWHRRTRVGQHRGWVPN
jgi:hypothetical protein